MQTGKIEEINQNYLAAQDFSAEFTIGFFERNNTIFKNITTLEDENELKIYIRMVWRLLNAFYERENLNEIVDLATKYLKIIDHEMGRLNLTWTADDLYCRLILFKGMALYNLRKYKYSTAIFERLLADDPRNENYKNWLRHSKYAERIRISKTIRVVSIVSFLLEIFLEGYISSLAVQSVIVSIISCAYFSSLIYDIYSKRKFKRDE
jgi:tetratricopeptide (TPR) repeat protein